MQNKKSIFFAKYLEIAPTTEHAQLYVLEPHILHILNVWWTVVGLLVFSFLIKQRNPSQNVWMFICYHFVVLFVVIVFSEKPSDSQQLTTDNEQRRKQK